MKRFLILLTCLFTMLISSCESDDRNGGDSNNFLGDSRVNFELRLNLPINQDLRDGFGTQDRFISKNEALGSLGGVYVKNLGNNTFIAVELAEPNQPLGNCSTPTEVLDGLFFEYDCDGEKTKYEVFSGVKVDGEEGDFKLRMYLAVRNGDILTISG